MGREGGLRWAEGRRRSKRYQERVGLMLNTPTANTMVVTISQHAMATAQTAWGEAAQCWGRLGHPNAVETAGGGVQQPEEPADT